MAPSPAGTTSESLADHQLPMKWSILKPMAAASFTATWFITPQPDMKIQSGLSRRTWSHVAFCSWPGMVHREQRQLEAVLLRQLLQRRVGLLAVGAVVEDVGDLLALELVEPALLLRRCSG